MEIKCGKLDLIVGCMFSGKSTEMIRLVNRYKNIKDLNLLIINHKSDNRYGTNIVSSHDKLQIDCISLYSLKSLKETENYIKADVIFIEEGQFFKDLYSFTVYSLEVKNKRMFIFGLDGDYLKNPFGDICRLLPMCENIKKLKALCAKCQDGTEANFTKRIVESKKIELVGVNEYIPVCRYHHLNN